MKVLVTGANGFLGRHVVSQLIARGHTVRAMVRPGAVIDRLTWRDAAELFRVDLRAAGNLPPALEGVDCLVHLAAAVTGDEETQFTAAVAGTENLMEVVVRSNCRRMILASSLSVYDWNSPRRTLDEQTPVESRRLYERDGYAIAKIWQERVVRKAADEHGIRLTVMRPGFIWGKGNDYVPGLAGCAGRFAVIVGPAGRLPLTYVENCASAFVAACESPLAEGHTFNVIDDDSVRAWRFAGEALRWSGRRVTRLPLPYIAGYTMATVAQAISRLCFGPRGKLPSMLVPIRFQARFRPMRYDSTKLRRVLGWQPPYSFDEALRCISARELKVCESKQVPLPVAGGLAE